MRQLTVLARSVLVLTLTSIGTDLCAQGISSVEARGHLVTTQVELDQEASFVLTIANSSPMPVHDVRIAHVGGAQVRLKHAWWCKDPQAVTSWSALRSCQIAETLAPHQSLTIFGGVDSQEQVVASVSAIVEWLGPDRSQLEVQLGQLDVKARWRRWASSFASAFPVLALPLVLAILGAWFQRRLSTLEHSRQQHAQKLADERAERDRLRAELRAHQHLFLRAPWNAGRGQDL